MQYMSCYPLFFLLEVCPLVHPHHKVKNKSSNASGTVHVLDECLETRLLTNHDRCHTKVRIKFTKSKTLIPAFGCRIYERSYP